MEAGRAGGSSETAAGAAAAAASGEVDAGGVARGRLVDAAFLAGCAFCAVGCDEVNLAKSSRMLRAASQPDRSNKPSPTLFLTRPVIVIPPT